MRPTGLLPGGYLPRKETGLNVLLLTVGKDSKPTEDAVRDLQHDILRSGSFLPDEGKTTGRDLNAGFLGLISLSLMRNARNCSVSGRMSADRQKISGVRRRICRITRGCQVSRRVLDRIRKKLRNIRECAQKHSQFENEVQNKEYELAKLREKATSAVNDIMRLKNELEDAENFLNTLNAKGAEAKAELDALQRNFAVIPEPDFEREKQILRIIKDSEDIAVKINENMHRMNAAKEADAMTTRYKEMTAAIEEIDRQKRELIAAKEMPVAGLSFDPEGEELLLNSLPLSQASSAERIKVSTLMGFALKPKCKLLLIHNGSLLDNTSRATIARLATENGGLVISEVAGTDSKMGIVIENGEVAEDRRHWEHN